jgi:general nucleoside transport system permease protein
MQTNGTSPADLVLQAACCPALATRHCESKGPGMSEIQTEPAAPVASPAASPGFRSPMPRRWRGMLETVAIPAGAIFISIILFGLFCAVNGANPLAVYASINKAAFASWYAWQETLVRAAPLMLCALCTAIPIRLGLVIIGNEGALVIGGLFATAAGLAVPHASPLATQIIMAGAGMLCGGLWIMIVGALKYFRGVNETISGLLMNYIAIAILNQMVNGPMRDPSSLNKPSSYPIPDEKMLQPIGSTSIHWGLVYGIVACVIVWFLVHHTTFGFKMRTIGGNIRAARIAGLPVGSVTLIACFIAGALPGLAGMVEVAAVNGSANESLNAWYGNSGILVAFLARQNALAVIVVSILLGGLLASGGILQRVHHLPDATTLVFQGLVFLVILFSESLYGRWKIFQEKAA